MDWMKDDGIFMPMINDTGRNKFYKRAIESLSAGKIVCDIGTGTGLLSVLAVKSGAARVYAVEQDPGRAAFAQSMFKRLGITDRVTLIEDNFLNTRIPADIYVSETINAQIFGENIIELANHAQQFGGNFIPGRFEITAQVYKNHPIFSLCQAHSDAFEFQPDISIDPVFEKEINSQFQQAHPLENTLYRANMINGLFTQLPRFTDLKLTKLSETEPLVVDLNTPIDVNSLKLTIPKTQKNSQSDVYVVLHWKAVYQDVVMDVDSTWFGRVSKTILSRCRNPNLDISIWYDATIQDWRLSF
jgi:predicted RNA methylase